MDALAWVTAERGVESPSEAYCPARDIAEARVARLRAAGEQAGFSPDTAALLAAVAGELAANCFDHNLGAWRDLPGCWFAYEFAPGIATLVIADRGQGFLGSLRRVRPALSSHRDALVLAFTAHVSGREPEQRGIGLSFVLEVLNGWPASRLCVRTGTAGLDTRMPVVPEDLAGAVTESAEDLRGTFVEVRVAFPGMTP